MDDGLGTEISMNRNVSIEAARRAQVALKCVDSLLPDATPRRRRILASKILSMCWDERAGFMRGMTQRQAQELISPHMQCLEAQLQRVLDGGCGGAHAHTACVVVRPSSRS